MADSAYRWMMAISLGLAIHVGLYWGVAWTRGPRQSLLRSPRQSTEIHYVDASSSQSSPVLTMFDPRPLVLPTRWNSANTQRLDEILVELDVFDRFAPQVQVQGGDFVSVYGSGLAPTFDLASVQTDFSTGIFAAAGEAEPGFNRVADDAGVEFWIRNPLTGADLLRKKYQGERLESLRSLAFDWRPAVLLAIVEKGFLVGGLAVLESSGNEAVDRVLIEIARDAFFGKSYFADGIYRLEIAP